MEAVNKRPVRKIEAPKDPIREVLEAMTVATPPDFVRGYSFKDLTEEQTMLLQDWCASHVRPSWLTGIGLMDAAESQVMEAVNNGNIPEEPH